MAFRWQEDGNLALDCAMPFRARLVVLAASLALPGMGLAQATPPLTPLESYERVTTLVNYMTSYVGELLLACAAQNALTEAQAEESYQVYRKRNAGMLEGVKAWSEDAERRLQAQGEAQAARRVAEEGGQTGMAAASIRAQGAIGTAKDVRAACATVTKAIEAGNYDLARNAELADLMKGKP